MVRVKKKKSVISAPQKKKSLYQNISLMTCF